MRLRIPKTHQQHIRENTLLRVIIPVVRDPKNLHPESYIGTGNIKRVQIKAQDPLLTVILQIDILSPNDKNQD